MDEPRAQTQRMTQEASRRMQESTKEVANMVNQLADRGAQASAALTEANQRVINEFMGLSMEMAQESSRLLMRLQQGSMDMLREAQTAALRSQMVWPEIFTDPMSWYRAVWQQGIEAARKT